MPYDIALADRVRPLLRKLAGFEEKAMFGGVAFLLHGHLCSAVWEELLILRVGAECAETLLRERHFRPFDVTGRPMTGWVMAEPEAVETRDDLERCVDLAVDFVTTLPPKAAAGSAKSRRPRVAKKRRPRTKE